MGRIPRDQRTVSITKLLESTESEKQRRGSFREDLPLPALLPWALPEAETELELSGKV